MGPLGRWKGCHGPGSGELAQTIPQAIGTSLWVPWEPYPCEPIPWGFRGPWPPLGGGRYTLERHRGEWVSPCYSLGDPPRWPPILGLDYAHSEGARSHLFYRFLPIFRTFLGEYASMLLFDMHADFFGRFVLQRNRYIRRVELFRARSLPRKIWETSRIWPLEGSQMVPGRSFLECA